VPPHDLRAETPLEATERAVPGALADIGAGPEGGVADSPSVPMATVGQPPC
jgi:hypothetical protein